MHEDHLLPPDDPLRLWIAGDSLAGSLGASLGEMTAETGVVAPVYDSRVSSGLANPSFFNWPKHATTELARLRPEAVAFIIGTNDYVIVNGTSTQGAGLAGCSAIWPGTQRCETSRHRMVPSARAGVAHRPPASAASTQANQAP